MKDQKLREILKNDIGDLELQRIDAGGEVANKRQTIDSAVVTQDTRSVLELKISTGTEGIPRDLLFPDGLYFGYIWRFGTATALSQSSSSEKVTVELVGREPRARPGAELREQIRIITTTSVKLNRVRALQKESTRSTDINKYKRIYIQNISGWSIESCMESNVEESLGVVVHVLPKHKDTYTKK